MGKQVPTGSESTARGSAIATESIDLFNFIELYNDKAQLKWARKVLTEIDMINRHRLAKFLFAGVVTPAQRSRTPSAFLA
jgi:hypothetical protein